MPDHPADRDKVAAANPSSFAETTPLENAANSSWMLEATMELQRSFGRVEKAVESLEKASDKHGNEVASLRSSLDEKLDAQRKSISNLQKVVWGAVGAYGLLVLILEHRGIADALAHMAGHG